MNDLIRKKIEYLLKILEEGQTKNNNLSTLVETAIEVIKLNQEKLKSFRLSKETNEINDIISEFEKNNTHFNDEQVDNLVIILSNSLNTIEDKKLLKENMKGKFNNVMSELIELSESHKNASKETNISKIVETALDIIRQNKIISKNKQYIAEIQEKTEDILNKLNEIIKEIQINKDKEKDNTKALVETAIDIISQPKPIPTPIPISNAEPIVRDDDKNNNNKKALVDTAIDIISQPKSTPIVEPEPIVRHDDKNDDNKKELVDTAIDIVSQPKPIPQSNIGNAITENDKKEDEDKEISQLQIISDNKKEEEKNIQTKLSSIFRKFNSEYIFFNTFLKDHISEINEKKNAEIEKLKEEYNNKLNNMNISIIELENEIKSQKKSFQEQDENSWALVNSQQKIIETLNIENEKKQENINKLETQQNDNENQIQILNMSIQRQQQEIDNSNKQINDLEKNIRELTNANKINIEQQQNQIQTLQNTIDQNKEKQKQMARNLSNNVDLSNRLTRENKDLQEQIEGFKQNILDNNAAINNLQEIIDKNKAEYEIKEQEYIEIISDITNTMKNNQESFEKSINEKINEIENMKDEIKNKDKQLLVLIKKVVDFIPNLQDDINKLDVFFPEITKMKNILQGIKSKTDCPGSDNLIGKIDNECLYFDKDTNKIISKSNEDNVLDALIEENKKIREQYREKIGIIKTLHSNKVREIEELQNSNKVQEDEEGEIPYISG
jgi:chromosome segregation ATPase